MRCEVPCTRYVLARHLLLQRFALGRRQLLLLDLAHERQRARAHAARPLLLRDARGQRRRRGRARLRQRGVDRHLHLLRLPPALPLLPQLRLELGDADGHLLVVQQPLPRLLELRHRRVELLRRPRPFRLQLAHPQLLPLRQAVLLVEAPSGQEPSLLRLLELPAQRLVRVDEQHRLLLLCRQRERGPHAGELCELRHDRRISGHQPLGPDREAVKVEEPTRTKRQSSRRARRSPRRKGHGEEEGQCPSWREATRHGLTERPIVSADVSAWAHTGRGRTGPGSASRRRGHGESKEDGTEAKDHAVGRRAGLWRERASATLMESRDIDSQTRSNAGECA